MSEIILAFAEALLDGWWTLTGRWVLSLGGWKSNVVGETVLGFFVWILAICLAIALFASIV